MISLGEGVRETLLAHAQEGAPEEVCGVLGGRRDDPVRVESVHRAPNVAGRPRVEYTIDPAVQLDVMDDIEASGEEVVGFYHSHPVGPDGPSETDVARATWPEHYYLIVSLDGPTVGAWYWDGEGFERAAVSVE